MRAVALVLVMVTCVAAERSVIEPGRFLGRIALRVEVGRENPRIHEAGVVVSDTGAFLAVHPVVIDRRAGLIRLAIKARTSKGEIVGHLVNPLGDTIFQCEGGSMTGTLVDEHGKRSVAFPTWRLPRRTAVEVVLLKAAEGRINRQGAADLIRRMDMSPAELQAWSDGILKAAGEPPAATPTD